MTWVLLLRQPNLSWSPFILAVVIPSCACREITGILNKMINFALFRLIITRLYFIWFASPPSPAADRIEEGFGCRRSVSPGLQRSLCPPSLPAAGTTKARCFAAPPPSAPRTPSLPGGWCPERRMTNASASAYWRIWTTWLQPRTVPTASTRCWLNGRGLAVDGPICVCIEKRWQSGVSV